MLTPVSKRRVSVDYTLLGLVALLVAMGLFTLQSASAEERASWHMVQLGWLLFGAVLSTVVAVVDYRVYGRHAYVIFGVVVGMLFLVLFVGTTRNNATRWLDLGVLEAQPSELMKVAIILITARFLHDRNAAGGHRLKDLAVPLVLVTIPCLLIAAQPDLGTAVVIFAIFMTILLFEGIRRSSLVLLIVGALLLAGPVWTFGLQDYQKTRILAFVHPEDQAHESAWQVRQAIIAVASGGVSGKGYERGTQVQSGFVPENENDFIFAHIGEEFGFLGGLALLGLYAALIMWSLRIARYARDKFGVLLAVGIAALFFWHVVINVGMVLGLMPVVGLWLPFVSYGGSSILTVMICVGLLMNLSIRRHVFQ